MSIRVVLIRLVLAACLLTVGTACGGDDPVEPEVKAEPSIAAAEEPIEGVFSTQIPDAEFEEFDYLPDHFGGRWTLTVSDGDYVLEGPIFRVTEEILQTAEDTWEIDATPAPSGAFNCYDPEGERLTGPGEASGAYEVTLEEDELTLAPLEEPCELRALFLERTWTRK